MRIKVLLALFMVSVLIPVPVLGSEVTAGEDVNPAEDEVPFTVVERTTPSIDKQLWSLAIEMNQEEYDNGTTFELTTQICTNDGVCDPPVLKEAKVSERTYAISLSPPSDHTYVNWRVKAVYSDENSTNFPQGDWYKTWSSCHYVQDTGWGGDDYTSDGCATDSEETLPGFAAVVTLTSISMAVAFTRRD